MEKQAALEVFVVEDDADIRELVQYNLEREGFVVTTFMRGDLVAPEVERSLPALIVLDVMLPGMSGLEVCRKLRSVERTKSVPIILLTARAEESDKVIGLELGADDYIVKPFSTRELVARVKAIIRRSQPAVLPVNGSMISNSSIRIDTDRHEVVCLGEVLTFTLAEFKLVKALVANSGRVLSRDQLLDHITGGDVVVIDRNVDVHIRSVRKKLGAAAGLIETVRGVGYKCLDKLPPMAALSHIVSGEVTASASEPPAATV